MTGRSTTRPGTVSTAAVVLTAEGALALALGIFVAVATVIGTPDNLVSAIAEAVFAILAGTGLLWVAWGLWRTLRWSRGPAVVTQIFVLPVAITLIQAGQYVFGIPLLAAAACALVTLLAPPSTRALTNEPSSPDSR